MSELGKTMPRAAQAPRRGYGRRKRARIAFVPSVPTRVAANAPKAKNRPFTAGVAGIATETRNSPPNHLKP